MVTRRSGFQNIHKTKSRVSVAISIMGLVLGAGGLSLTATSSASADSSTNVNGCSFQKSATEWVLQADCSSSHEIDLPPGVTLDGNNFTISPTFTSVLHSNINNTAVGVLNSNNVAINDLTIDGVHGTNLHGINVYVSSGVQIEHVTVKNMNNTGIVVNGSVVSISNVTTSNNGWHGINVDLGGGVTTRAVLNIVGPMTQTDRVQILVDDTRKAVTVNDYLHQYSIARFGNAAVYTRIFATDKQTCREDGWKLGLSATHSFDNQGQCVAFFARGEKKSGSDENGDKSDSGNEKD